jgi:hypothetical protein
MIQLLPKAAYNAGYGVGGGNMGVFGGVGDFALPATFGINYTKAPVALDSTFRNLTILATDPFVDGAITVTLYVDGVATAQTVTLPAGETLAVSVGEDVEVTAGQDVNYHYQGPLGIGVGHDLAFCIEREGEGNVYGLTPHAGTIGVDSGVYGGAFNNGVLGTSYVPGLTVLDSLTYSIVAVSGTLTTLMLRTYAAVPDAGAWTAYLRVDQVLQNGVGGTVDTAVVLTGAATLATSTFSLPVTLGQRVDVVTLRTGTEAAFALAQVGVGVGFTPSRADAFMCCGGGNNVMPNTETGWTWPSSEQLGIGELRHLVPISASGLTVLGIYVERSEPPSGGYVHTIRRSGADTLATVTIQGGADSGLIDGLLESFASGQTMTLQQAPFDVDGAPPINCRLYWGLSAFAGATPEPPPIYEEITTTTRRLRRAPHLTDENHWLSYDQLTIDLEAGVGAVDGLGADPQVMVRWSNDGGHTWSNEHWVSAGKMGETKARAIVRRTGRARTRTFEVVVSDPVAWSLAAAYLHVSPGDGT